MRIYALITDAYGGHGGVSVHNRDLFAALASRPEVDWITVVPRVILNEIDALPEKVVHRAGSARGMLHFLWTILTDIRQVRRSNMIFCGHINLAPVAWLLGCLTRRPVLCALHGIDAWTPPHRTMSRLLGKRLSHYYAVSSYTRQRFMSWTGLPESRIAVLPNAVHLQDYGPGPKPDALVQRFGLQGRKVLLTFGRLVSRDRAKGFDEVLNVLPELVREYPSLSYLIAGEGDYRKALEARVATLDLQDHVVFTGFVEEAEKGDLYRLADLYVMPSRGEGFGFVFLEAMASGVPVIASTVDGSRDAVMDGKLGQMVDPDDSEALMLAIRAGLKAPREVPDGLSFFSFDSFSQRVWRIVRQLAKQ